MKISGYQRFSLKIPVSVDKHNLFILINAKYNLWKQPKTLYIQKILKPPTTSFGIQTTSFGIHFSPSNYEFWNTTASLIFGTRSWGDLVGVDKQICVKGEIFGIAKKL